MGLPSERFVTPVDENLHCGICHGVFLNPVVTDCGHTFCASCLKIWITTSHHQCEQTEIQCFTTCPTCRNKLYFRKLTKLATEQTVSSIARPVFALRNLINSLSVYCENAKRGCTVIGPVDRMHCGLHTKVCAYAPVECAGCGRTINRIELAAHQLSCYGIQAELSDTEPLAPEPNLTADIGTQTADIPTSETQPDPRESNDSLIPIQTTNSSVQTDCPFKICESFCETGDHFGPFINYDKRSEENLKLLNVSLIKLVHALRIELETAHEELGRQYENKF